MLEEAPINEDDTVRVLLKKKTGGQIPADWKERQKLAAFLGRKGFSFDVIQRVLRESTDDLQHRSTSLYLVFIVRNTTY